MNRPIAFLTMDSLDGFFAYDQLTYQPLSDRGWSVREISWRAKDLDWNEFEAVIIRSTWDYQDSADEFLQTLQAIDRSTATLLNGLETVRWNINKTYLRDLGAGGVPVIPTLWHDRLDASAIALAFETFACDELVVKPTVGAGADDTFRVRRDADAASVEQLVGLYQTQAAMIQPFLQSVVTTGEHSLFYFASRYSHTITKLPKPGDFRVQEEHGGQLTASEPTVEMLEIASSSLALTPEPTLYARVDLLPLADGRLAVVELELIEPSLYFPYSDGSPERFAAAVDAALHQRLTTSSDV